MKVLVGSFDPNPVKTFTVGGKKCTKMLKAFAFLLCAVCPSLSSAWRRCHASAEPTRHCTAASPPLRQTPPPPPSSCHPSPSAAARSSPTAGSHRPSPPWTDVLAQCARCWTGSHRSRRCYHSCPRPLGAQQLCHRRRHPPHLSRRSTKTEASRH